MSEKPFFSKIVPYQNEFSRLKSLKGISDILLYSAGFISIVVPIIVSYQIEYPKFFELIKIINFIIIVAYYIIDVTIEVFINPAVSEYQRLNFVDNSLGTKFLGNRSQHYFDNDEVKGGMYKVLVNGFENCFFTYSLSKAQRKSMVFKNSVFGLIFLIVAYFGLIQNTIGLPIIQIFLSSLFLTELIHHLNFTNRLKNLLTRYKEVFTELEKWPYKRLEVANPLKLSLEYETLLAYNKSGLSDKIYEKKKVGLTKEWNKMKDFYNIS
jgi:hypothetical protein